MTIREYLTQHKLITDGSFGTYYAERFETQEMPELANINHPERVIAIHKSYIEAGAKLLRTNTFASNTVLMHTELPTVLNNIRASVELAREAIRQGKAEDADIYIAGDIGPIPNDDGISGEEIEEQYYRIAKTFINENIHILTFETLPDMEHLLPAIVRIRKETDKELFIMVQFCINQFGYSNAGLSAKRLLHEASAQEVIDAVGLNCGVGPAHMEQILGEVGMAFGAKFRIAIPNAGYPKRIRNAIRFSNNADYFADKMQELVEKYDCDMIGGCCGTNPDFIRRLGSVIDTTQKERHTEPGKEAAETKVPLKQGFFYEEGGKVKQKKLIAVELAPPANADDEKLLEAAHILQKANVDVLTFPDSPSGRTRVDSVLMAEKVRRETGMEVMPHICCRDKNAIAMRSLFLGAYINDIHNLLIITGDPVPTMVRQTVKAVFNFDSVGLMQIAGDMNEEEFQYRPLCYGGAINQGRRNLAVEINRVKKKMEAGAEFFFTQPVFSKEDADKVRQIKEETGARILCGIMPLISRRNALFMKNEIAGIAVTDEIIARYPENGTKAEGEAVGVEIAREIMDYTEDFVDGYYFSFPFNRVYLLEQIVQKI